MTTQKIKLDKKWPRKGIVLFVILPIFACLVLLFMLVGPGVNLLAKLGLEPVCIQGAWPDLEIVSCPTTAETFKELTISSPINLNSDAKPLIIDTDMAPDDWMAIIYLLRRPDIDVRAITVTGVGETHCEPGVRNALDLVYFSGRSELPVACGRKTPLEGDHTFPEIWRDRADNMAGISLPENLQDSSSLDVNQLIIDTLLNSSEKTTIVALGPLTNLAEVFLQEPKAVERVEMVFIMGGAFEVPGNVGPSTQGIDNFTAEWNIYIDPYASNIVLQSGAPITIIPLDATNQVPITESFYNKLAKDRTTQAAEFVYQLLTRQYDLIQNRLYWFWDPLAAAISTNEDLGTYHEFSVYVVEEGGPDAGATRKSDTGGLVRVIVNVEAEDFEKLFLDVINDRNR